MGVLFLLMAILLLSPLQAVNEHSTISSSTQAQLELDVKNEIQYFGLHAISIILKIIHKYSFHCNKARL